MKNGIAIIAIALIAIMAGGLSMGCIDAPVQVPDSSGLTEKGKQVKADVAERQARGFVQYTGTIVNVTVPEVVEVVEDSYILTYIPYIAVMYPDNVKGWDTMKDRAFAYQAKLNYMVEYYDGERGRSDFYLRLYQSKQDKYQKMYEYVGNTILTDSDFVIERGGNATGNGSA